MGRVKFSPYQPKKRRVMENTSEGLVENQPGEVDAKPELEPLKFDPNKKVAIVGTSMSWMKAPYEDESVEIWGVNNGFINLGDKRKTRWFDVHTIEHREDGRWYRRWDHNFRGQTVGDYIEDLKKLECPVYMQQEWPEIPNSKRFPIEQVTGYFGSYITNSIAMQFAYALTEGFGEIQLWGIDMSHGTEWAYQRPNCEYFIGLAVGLGVKVLVPDESDLLKTLYIYAYGERDKNAFVKKAEILEKNNKIKINRDSGEISQLKAEYERKQAEVNQRIGVLQGIKEMKKLWIHDLGNWHYPDEN